MNLFSGPSTPQMRLTAFLIGAGASVFGIFMGNRRTEGAAYNRYGDVVYADCGSPFKPVPSRNFFPELADACSAALAPGLPLAVLGLGLGAVFLIRFLYMLVGPKVQPAPQ